MKAKTGAERSRELRQRYRAAGLVNRGFWLTEEQAEKVKKMEQVAIEKSGVKK